MRKLSHSTDITDAAAIRAQYQKKHISHAYWPDKSPLSSHVLWTAFDSEVIYVIGMSHLYLY